MTEATIHDEGTVVQYHGSLPEYHGLYVVGKTHRPRHSVEKYPGGVAYNLHAYDPDNNTLEADPILWNVRGSSFTPHTD